MSSDTAIILGFALGLLIFLALLLIAACVIDAWDYLDSRSGTSARPGGLKR